MEMMCLYFLFAVSVLALHTAVGQEEVVENAAERSRSFKPRVNSANRTYNPKTRYQKPSLPQGFSTNIVSAKPRSPNAGATQISIFDALSKGEGQWPITSCPTTIKIITQQCKVQYTLRRECSLYEVVNNLFKPLKQDNDKFKLLSTGKYSRGLVKLADYKFASASSFIFNTCDQGKKTLKFQLNSAEVKLNDWLSLKSIELQVELNYGFLYKPITEDWFVTKITGKATMTVGGEEVEVDISQNAEEGSSNNKKFNSQDVVLLPKTTSVKVQNFMSALQQDLSQLYPERLQQDLDYVTLYRLNELTVQQKDSTQVFNIILTGANTWDAYITGTPSTSFFDHATDFYVYCKNGEPDDYDSVMCAIMCKFRKHKFKWSSTTHIISGVPNELRDETTGLLLKVLQARQLYFRSSKRGFEIPNSIQVIKTFEEFVYLKGNTKSSVDPNEPEVETFNSRFVDSGMCLAARIEGLKERIPEFNLDALFVHVCPSFSKITLRVPFNYPKDVTDPSVLSYKFLPFLLLGVKKDERAFGIGNDQKVYLIEQELKRKPNGNLQFCHQYSFYPNYNFIDSSDTFQLNNMKFTECKAKAESQWELVGSGNEVILDAISEVQAKRIANNEYGVEGNLNIFDAGAIAERTASYLPDTHKTVFKNLNNFTITTCKFEGSFRTPIQIIFSGTALIRNNFVFEMKYRNFVRLEPQRKSLALCLVGENDSMGDIIGYFYMNPLMRQFSWKKFKKIGVISRATGPRTNWQNVDCQAADDNSLPATGIKVYAENIDLTNCDEGGQTNLVCKFLQRCYGSTLNIVYTGVLIPDNIYYMNGQSNQIMQLGPGLTFKAKYFRTIVKVEMPEMRGKKKKGAKKINKKSTTDKPTLKSKDYVMGDLTVESIHVTFNDAIISFNGDEVMLQIQRSASRNVLDVLGIPNVKTHYGVHTDPYALSNDLKGIETIEMHSRLFIGNTPGEEIELWGGQLKTVQYLHGKELSKNRFFACLSGKKMFVRRLFKAFGANYQKNIFKDYLISDTSYFTYHNQDTLWNLPSKNLRVEKGLRLIGELKKEENSENSIRMEAVFEDGAVEMTVFLPKQNWGKTNVEETRTVSETQSDGTVKPKEIKVTKTITRTEMTLDENNNAESLGPKYVVKYSNTELVKASIEGYIRTIGYSGAGKFEITANPNNPSKEISSLYHFSYTSGEKLFGAYDGTISLTAISDTIDLDKLDFTVNIDILNSVSNAINASVVKNAVGKYAESYKNVYKSLLSKLKLYEDLEKKYANFVQEFSRSSQTARESVQRSRIKRARSLQSANKRCSHECKAVHMPGLKWDGNCMTTSSGHIAGCMKFFPSKDIVSDVGCLSRCESERVRSHVEAITRDAETRNLIAEYQYKAQCEEIASKLHYDIITSELKTLKKLRDEVTGDAGEFMRSIIETTERNPQFVQLMHLNANVKLNDIEQPSCVNFEVKFSINLHDGAVSTPQYIKSVCFTGNSAEILVEDAFERAFKDKNVELQGKLDDIEASISKLDAEYESKFKGNRETYVNNCLEKKPLIFSAEDEGKFKRTYIPGLELSPLHTSNFHVFSDQTILLFEKYSPWSTLERDDPFHEVEKHSLQKSESQPDNSNTVCAATKRTVDDFQDIVGYMKKWAHAHQNGQESLLNIRTSIAKQLNNTATAISDDASRAMSSIDTENMYHWLSVTEVGIKRWLDVSTQHLEKLNKEGFSLLKARVKTMYQDKGHDNFEAYFTKLAQDGNTAFKKARIETPDGDFSVLAKDLLEIWKKDYTLNEMTPLLGKLEKTVEKAEKRSVSCVD